MVPLWPPIWKSFFGRHSLIFQPISLKKVSNCSGDHTVDGQYQIQGSPKEFETSPIYKRIGRINWKFWFSDLI